MSFFDFETVFFDNLKSQNNNCINDIENHEKLIIKYLGEKTDNKTLKNFLNKFNETILYNKNNNFNLIEKILFHPIFKNVSDEFRESDILIKACKIENKPLVKWLLTMDINLNVQDEYGMTTLMYASKSPQLLFALKILLKNNKDDFYSIVDRNGENAFFHAVHNLEGFDLLLKSKMVKGVNQLNNNKDSVLTYCCRNGIYEPVLSLIVNANVDPNIFNNEERTATMYLVENGRYQELEYIKKWKTNFEYRNSKNESALSILVRQYYKYYQEKETKLLQNYIRVVKVLVEKECSFNTVIDEEGNTAFMFFLWLQDWCTIIYLLLKQKELDFQKQNKNGINASLLCIMLQETETSISHMITVSNLMDLYLNRIEFETGTIYQHGNNLLMYSIINNNEEKTAKLLLLNENLIHQVNDKKENPLIVAIKLGNRDIIKNIVSRNVDVNFQDEFGNTALHYALELGDQYVINLLTYCHADIHLKNKEGKSPIEIVKESENGEIMSLLNNPVLPYKLLNDKYRIKNKEKKKITSLFKRNKNNINHVKIDDGDIVISKCNAYQKDYEDSIKFSSKLYRPQDNNVFISAIRTFELTVYSLINSDGGIIINYNKDIRKVNLPNLFYTDDIEKRILNRGRTPWEEDKKILI